MAKVSIECKERLVAAYLSGATKSYRETARRFGVSLSTVTRAIKQHRETGRIAMCPRGGNNPRRVDLSWLRVHAKAYPKASLSERVEAWRVESGVGVQVSTMCYAMRAIGWVYTGDAWCGEGSS